MEVTRSKRAKRDENLRKVPLGPSNACYRVCPRQLRALMDFDNSCALKYFLIPLRKCSLQENASETDTQLQQHDFELLKNYIQNMWKQMSSLFEFFKDENHPELGFRIRVKQDLPIKVSLNQSDFAHFGWATEAPQDGPCAHLYERSPVEYNGYLGGPISFCNWAPTKEATITVHRSRGPKTYQVTIQTTHRLPPGTELLWTYGCPSSLPIFKQWFQPECCNIGPSPSERPVNINAWRATMEVNSQLCVLCGHKFACKNVTGRIQMKPHFVDSHADYLGTGWDGYSTYGSQEVDGNLLLQRADNLNSFLQKLIHDLRWNVFPACKVFTDSELHREANNPAELLHKFKSRCSFLRRSGTVVIRGTASVIACIEELRKVAPVCWKKLSWKEGTKPKRGYYSVPKTFNSADLMTARKESVKKYCIQALSTNDDDDSDHCFI